jgi:hypothetical protein
MTPVRGPTYSIIALTTITLLIGPCPSEAQYGGITATLRGTVDDASGAVPARSRCASARASARWVDGRGLSLAAGYS